MIKQGNPVNGLHIKAVGLVFGSDTVLNLLGMMNTDGSAALDPNPEINDHLILARRVLNEATPEMAGMTRTLTSIGIK